MKEDKPPPKCHIDDWMKEASVSESIFPSIYSDWSFGFFGYNSVESFI
jgi:hypothetical protein